MIKEMKVEVLLRDTIKPSSPTPHYLRSVKLSFLDQIAPALYVPLIFFYPNKIDDNNITKASSSSYLNRRRCDLIKKSLAETLTKFYPLAGRIEDESFTVDCNDNGISYVEATVKNCGLSEVIHHPDARELEQKLLPFDPYGCEKTESSGFNTKVLLAVQVNVFDQDYGGGIAIGVCFWHKVTDAPSAITFMNFWAATARGTNELIKSPDFESPTPFPRRNNLLGYDNIMNLMPVIVLNLQGLIVTKRFVFGVSQIAELQRRSIKRGSTNTNTNSGRSYHVHQEYRPTAIEVVSAFIWRSFIDVYRTKRNKGVVDERVYAGTHVVNIRRRTVSPLPKNAFGNIGSISVAISSESGDDKGEIDVYPNLVRKMRDSIKKIDGKHVRELQTSDALLNFWKDLGEGILSGRVVHLHFSSLCRNGVYETDFGWGGPIFVSNCKLPLKNLVYLVDTSSGDGIEAWVSLTKEDMADFERDEELLALLSVGRSNL